MQSAFAITLFHCLPTHGPFFAQKRSACSLELFCESRAGAGETLIFMRHHSLWLEDSAGVIEPVGHRSSTLLDKSTCARRWW